VFKNVVAQFIGRLCLINQATTKFWGRNTSEMAEIEQGIKIKQPVEGLPRYPFVTLRASAHRNDKREGLAMAPFCHPERSEGIVVVAGFIPASGNIMPHTSVGDKPRPYRVFVLHYIKCKEDC